MFNSIGSVIPEYDRFTPFPTLFVSNLNLFKISYSNLETVGKGIYCYLRFFYPNDGHVSAQWHPIYPKAESERIIINSFDSGLSSIGIEVIKYARYNRRSVDQLRVNIDIFNQPVNISNGLTAENLADIQAIIQQELANIPTFNENSTQLLEQFQVGNSEIIAGQQVINNSLTEISQTLEQEQGVLNVGNNLSTLLNN